MAKRCEFAKLEIISNAGHNIHFENTFAFVKSIRTFLM
jgi:2-succinyl-6-hydroxy-2,4-cyclohexadiene-1-carboxylate synthase